jgi:hypothetical protein
MGIAGSLKGGGVFLKIPDFHIQISKILFCVADFHGQFLRIPVDKYHFVLQLKP